MISKVAARSRQKVPTSLVVDECLSRLRVASLRLSRFQAYGDDGQREGGQALLTVDDQEPLGCLRCTRRFVAKNDGSDEQGFAGLVPDGVEVVPERAEFFVRPCEGALEDRSL